MKFERYLQNIKEPLKEKKIIDKICNYLYVDCCLTEVGTTFSTDETRIEFKLNGINFDILVDDVISLDDFKKKCNDYYKKHLEDELEKYKLFYESTKNELENYQGIFK